VLPSALPNREEDLVLALDKLDIHVNVADILGQFAPGTFDDNEAGLDADSDTLRDR